MRGDYFEDILPWMISLMISVNLRLNVFNKMFEAYFKFVGWVVLFLSVVEAGAGERCGWLITILIKILIEIKILNRGD